MMTHAAVCPDHSNIPPIVLLVADHADTRDMYTVLLESAGMWVAGAETPSEAIHAVDELTPDLVVADLGFRQPLGVKFVELIKQHENTAHTPVILVSAYSPATIGPATNVQADVCLLKPVAPEELIAQINRLLCLLGTSRRDQPK